MLQVTELFLHCFRERSMDLMMSLESSNSIAWCGISNTKVGTLKPGVSIDIPLCLIALHGGIIVSIMV